MFQKRIAFLLHRVFSAGLPVLSVIVLTGCSQARYVPKGDYLLSRNRIETRQKSDITQEELQGYVLQNPNKRMLGIRLYLFLYNLSNPAKEKWPHNWLRKIGEEPVIFDSTLTKTSVDQLKQFLSNKGYNNSLVKDTVRFHRKNASVLYRIEYGKPYRIRTIRYVFEDTALAPIILADTVNSILHKNIVFNKDKLGLERTRIESLLKEKGYFNFSKEYIFYEAVTNSLTDSVGLTMHVKEYIAGEPDPHTKIRPHPKYRIREVQVFPDFADNFGNNKKINDTAFVKNVYFLTPGRPNLKPNAIMSRNYILPGEYYKLSDVNRTYRNLSNLSIVRFTNITFKEADSISGFGNDRYLDCRIELTQKKLQSLQFEIAGTNSSGDLGARGSLVYSNFNLFRGAEVLNMRFTGALESLKNQTNGQYKSMREFGISSNIVFPKFFAPFRFEGFVKRYAPKTSIAASINYQSRPDYTRSIANASFYYKWNSTPYLSHTFYPIELNYIRIYKINFSKELQDFITNSPLAYSFENHVINDIRYTLELNNQTLGKSRNFVFTRVNLESAAFFLHLANNGFNHQNDSSTYRLFNVPYFQYILGDVDLRYYNVIDRQNRVVMRVFAGAGVPYGNSNALPYEKKYFSGGPNSMRAWGTRDLGPGSYVDKTSDSLFYFPNRNGDIKLEGNIEYRFKLIWKIESALFLDAGNVWNMKKDPEKPNAEFSWNRFYKEIAVASGLGFRFDFSFFLLRVDIGLRLRDPSFTDGERWTNPFHNFDFGDLHFKFGIGYPF
ncbi:MAG TPA: BamA/TamA family outer membrane protein [Bacteroidales bacterium]|nr:BamA/TamA family outer membrane protein [Bacteroidales bacterium]